MRQKATKADICRQKAANFALPDPNVAHASRLHPGLETVSDSERPMSVEAFLSNEALGKSEAEAEAFLGKGCGPGPFKPFAEKKTRICVFMRAYACLPEPGCA